MILPHIAFHMGAKTLDAMLGLFMVFGSKDPRYLVGMQKNG